MNKFVVLFILFLSHTVNATIINFDEPFAHDNLISSFEFTNGGVTETVKYSALSDQYQHLGVDFGGDWLVVDNDPTFGESPISGNGFAAFNNKNNNILTLSFAQDINMISGFVGGGLDYCCFIDLNWTVSVFANGTNIVQQSFNSIASNSGGGYAFFSLDFQAADYIEIMANPLSPIVGQPDDRFGGMLENLSFTTVTSVPEPSTTALFGLLAISMLGRFSRRRDKNGKSINLTMS